jgi:hypothetical protein
MFRMIFILEDTSRNENYEIRSTNMKIDIFYRKALANDGV